MTNIYSDIDPLDALYNAVRKYPGGVEAIASRLGVASSVLRNKLRRAVTTHHLNVEEFSALLEYLEEAKVPGWNAALVALNWRHNHAAIHLPEVEAEGQNLMAHVLEMLSTEGRLAQNIGTVLADGRIDDKELERLELDLSDCIASLVKIRDQVRAKHEADFKRLRT